MLNLRIRMKKRYGGKTVYVERARKFKAHGATFWSGNEITKDGEPVSRTLDRIRVIQEDCISRLTEVDYDRHYGDLVTKPGGLTWRAK